jgi:hypothetical protein
MEEEEEEIENERKRNLDLYAVGEAKGLACSNGILYTDKHIISSNSLMT